MPVDRNAPKRFACEHPKCDKAFARKHDLNRHRPTHGPHEERPYACPVENCRFRANQLSGVEAHYNNIHLKRRLLCRECNKMYSDPSSLSVHKAKCHRAAAGPDDAGSGSGSSASAHQTRRPRRPTSQGAPLLWVNSTPQSISYKQIQTEHQEAYDANYPDGGPTAWDAPPTAVLASGPAHREPMVMMARPFDESLDPGTVQGVSNVSQPCQCKDCVDRHPLTLPPLINQQREMDPWNQMEVESDALFSFSYPRTGHVPPSILPNNICSSEYPRPNPRMLF